MDNFHPMKMELGQKARWGLQLVLWGALWLLMPLLSGAEVTSTMWMNRAVPMAVATVLVVGVNLFLLFPHLYLKKQYWIYFLAGLATSILLTWVNEAFLRDLFVENVGRPGRPPGPPGNRRGFGPMSYFVRSLPFMVAFLGSAMIEIFAWSQEQARQALTIQKEKLESEMKWLRWQMNPHFLFNALNNIYSLTVMKSDKAPEQLLSLSDMMRYMLYEGNKDRVPLSKEVEYLHKYIALQQLKDSNGMNVTVDIAAVSPDSMIAPQLLLPFVENAFKHSNIEDLERGWIRISLQQEARKIIFAVDNSVPARRYVKDGQGGLGLKNVRKLLELMYPDQHRLEITETNESFSICLHLTLH